MELPTTGLRIKPCGSSIERQFLDLNKFYVHELFVYNCSDRFPVVLVSYLSVYINSGCNQFQKSNCGEPHSLLWRLFIVFCKTL